MQPTHAQMPAAPTAEGASLTQNAPTPRATKGMMTHATTTPLSSPCTACPAVCTVPKGGGGGARGPTAPRHCAATNTSSPCPHARGKVARRVCPDQPEGSPITIQNGIKLSSSNAAQVQGERIRSSSSGLNDQCPDTSKRSAPGDRGTRTTAHPAAELHPRQGSAQSTGHADALLLLLRLRSCVVLVRLADLLAALLARLAELVARLLLLVAQLLLDLLDLDDVPEGVNHLLGLLELDLGV